MGYADHLRALLRPLGVYTLAPDSLSGAELEAMGEAFDALYAKMQRDLREALPITACEEGLTQYESLLGHPCAHLTVPERQAAICALLRMPQDGASPETLQSLAAQLGAHLSFDESTLPELLTIRLQTMEDDAAQRKVEEYLEQLLPCHLEPDYYPAQ